MQTQISNAQNTGMTQVNMSACDQWHAYNYTMEIELAEWNTWIKIMDKSMQYGTTMKHI